MAQNEDLLRSQVEDNVPTSKNNNDIVPDSFETENVSDSIESANNVSINCHSSSDLHPQVKKELKFLKSKF